MEQVKPGIYEGLPFSEYQDIDAWNPSLVVSGLVSMLQLHHDEANPKEATGPMIFGSAIHCSVLEPDEFPLRYCVWTGGRKAGKDYDVFCAANSGRDVLTGAQYDACLGARDAVRKHPAAVKILDGAKTEVSVCWTDHQTGLPCKGRLDLLGGCIADLKTTTASIANARALKNIASDFHYHVKLAAYQAGIQAVTGKLLPVKVIWVEQDAPHDCRVQVVPAATLAKGWDAWQSVLTRIVECEKSGVWPGCDETESDLEIWGADDPSVNVMLDGEPMF